MKKIIIIISCFIYLICFAFSENVFSLSVSPDLYTIKYEIQKNDEIDVYNIMDIDIKFGFDYKHLFDNGIMLGIQTSLQPDMFDFYSTSGALNGTTLSATGLGFTVAPIIGYRFGSRHLQGLELLPIVITNTIFSDNATVTNRIGSIVSEIKVPFSGNKTTYSSELRANIQFGNSLVRNGFIAGIGYVWLVDMSDITLKNTKTIFSDKYYCSGIFIEIGYKISFVN